MQTYTSQYKVELQDRYICPFFLEIPSESGMEPQCFRLLIDSITRGKDPHIFFLGGPVDTANIENFPGSVQVVLEYPKNSPVSPPIEHKVQEKRPTNDKDAKIHREAYNPYEPPSTMNNESLGLIDRLRKLFNR